MRKTVLALLGALLVVASTIQTAAAAGRHARKAARVPVPATQQVRNAYGSAAWPYVAQPDWFSNYSEGHVISAPAGR
jgi:hypothetical protein